MVAPLETLPSPTELLEYALAYHRAGYCVIPLWINAEKTKQVPIFSWRRYRTERPSELDVILWFCRWRVTGIGVALGLGHGLMGHEVGLVCRSCNHLGYEHWAHLRPEWISKLPTVIASTGYQVFARASDVSIAVVQRMLDKRPPGADLVSDEPLYVHDGAFLGGRGCYAVLPPSLDPVSGAYHWVDLWAGAPPTVDEIPLVEDLYDAGFGDSRITDPANYTAKPAEGGAT